MRLYGRVTLAELSGASFTYPDVGATATADLPAGYHHADRVAVVGSGAADFDRAARGLLGWRMHERSGLRVTASHPEAVQGAVVVAGFGAGPLRLAVPCRVIYRVDEPDRRGFGYGTLPGHPVAGEESFVVRLTGTGDVELRIRAFSRGANPVTRLAGPANRVLQRVATERYVRAVRELARRD